MTDSLIVPDLAGEKVLDVEGGAFSAGVERATDPVILPQPYASPADFDAQYPTPLDPTEIVAMCEEITAWQALPEETTALKQHTWRELNELAFTSGSAYISFADGECPEEYSHDGDNTTVTLKNIGAKKSLSISDIMHSQAVAASNWHGINRLVGGLAAGEGMPGGEDAGTFQRIGFWSSATALPTRWSSMVSNSGLLNSAPASTPTTTRLREPLRPRATTDSSRNRAPSPPRFGVILRRSKRH
jgi:hypothetical protein